jgi:Uncharacterized conserved protein
VSQWSTAPCSSGNNIRLCLRKVDLSAEALKFIGDAQADFSSEAASSVLSADQRAVLKYTDAMTKTVTVPDEVFAELKGCFDEREVVEITATIAAYNCVSRFLVALDVGEKNHLH